jgi:predicted transcriptional regulator
LLTELLKYQNRLEKIARVRALILKVVNARPGLTYEEIGKQILLLHGFLPTVGNRIRELRKIGYVQTISKDGRLRVYPKEASS